MNIGGYLSKLKKDFNEFKLQYNKQNIEDFSIQRAVKTIIQILYDKGLFDKFQNADKVLEAFFLQQDVDLMYQKKIHNYIHLYGY